jgi:hypothetical protein
VHCSNDENAYSPDAIGTKSSRSGRSERTRSHGGDNKEPSNAALGYIITARQVDASVRKITGTGGQRAAQNKQINRYRRWLTREILWSFLFPRSWNNKFDSASIAVCAYEYGFFSTSRCSPASMTLLFLSLALLQHVCERLCAFGIRCPWREARKSMRQDGGRAISESADSTKLHESIFLAVQRVKETVVQHQIIETVLKFISLGLNKRIIWC